MNRPRHSSHATSQPEGGMFPGAGENSEQQSQRRSTPQSHAAEHEHVGADIDHPMLWIAGNRSAAGHPASLGHVHGSLTSATMYRELLEARMRAVHRGRTGGLELPQQNSSLSDLSLAQASLLETSRGTSGELSRALSGRGPLSPPAARPSSDHPLMRSAVEEGVGGLRSLPSPPYARPGQAYDRSLSLQMRGLQQLQFQRDALAAQRDALAAVEATLVSQERLLHRTTLSPQERYVAGVVAEQQRLNELQLLRRGQQAPMSATIPPPPPPPPFGDLLSRSPGHQVVLERIRAARMQQQVQRSLAARNVAGTGSWVPSTASVASSVAASGVPWVQTNESVAADLSPLRALRVSYPPSAVGATSGGAAATGGDAVYEHGALSPLQLSNFAMAKARHDALLSHEGKTTDNDEDDDEAKTTAHEARGAFVDEITDLDVLCGRGGRSNHWPGNKRYRRVVSEMKQRYKSSEGRKSKTGLSRSIVEHVLNYGGRFVKEEDDTGRYYVLSKTEARIKTSQALRESKDLKWTD